MRYSVLPAFFFLTFLFTAGAQDQLSRTTHEALFQKGSEMVAHSNYGAARKVFSDFLQEAPASDPRRSLAEYYVAFSALTLAHHDGEKLIASFLSDHPSDPKASTAYYDLANFFYDEKNYAKASEYYGKASFASLSHDQQTEGHFRWAYSLFNQKRLEEALGHFNMVKNTGGPYAPAANYYAGFIAYSNGDLETALTDLKKAELNPAYAGVVPYLIANVYYRQQRFDELISYATAAKDRDGLANPNDFFMLLAEAYYYKGDFSNAASFYEKYLATNASRAATNVLFRAGYANFSLNQVSPALDYLGKAAARRDSVSYYASYYLGILNLRQNDKTLAINAFDYARKSPVDHTLAEEASFQFAKVSYDAGRTEQAIGEFEAFLKKFSGSPHRNEVRELLAQAYVNGNNYHKAIEYIESLPNRSQSVDQAYQKATYFMGVELFNREEYRAATEWFEKSLRYPMDPKYTTAASFWLAEALSIGNRFGEAVSRYEKILQMSGTTDRELVLKTRYGLGYAHYNMKAYDKALPNFQQFVSQTERSDLNHTDALIRLADCYYISKQYQPALANYNKARDIGSVDNDYILLQSGVINGILRNYADSRNQLTDLIRSYPTSQYRDEALYQRAQFEIETGNNQNAIDGLSQLILHSPTSKFTPYAHLSRAASYFNLKQFDKTIDDYLAVLTRFPTHPAAQDALLPLQEALSVAGRSAEFEKYLERFKSINPDNKNLEQIEFETARNLYFNEDYQRAAEKLRTFVAAYPQSARLPEARFYMAESYYRLKQFEKALPLYNEVAKDPTFTMANRVQGRIAEIQFKFGQYNDAIAHYHQLERLAASKRDQYNAMAGLMESFYLLTLYDSSAIYARRILEHGAVDASAQNKASLYLGKNAFAKGDFETAQDEFLNTVNAARDEYGAEAKYMIALILYQQKQYRQSYETLISLTNDFAAYDQWVGKAFLLMADNFMALGNVFQAKATLQSLIDNFPLPDLKSEAAAKLAQIEKEEADKAKTISSDTVEGN